MLRAPQKQQYYLREIGYKKGRRVFSSIKPPAFLIGIIPEYSLTILRLIYCMIYCRIQRIYRYNNIGNDGILT